MSIKHDNDKLEDIADVHQHAIDHVSGLGFYKNTCMDVAREYHQHMMRLRPASEWHEDMGDVLWFRCPINEPPYVGSPLQDDWYEVVFIFHPTVDTRAEYYTHFQLIQVPE